MKKRAERIAEEARHAEERELANRRLNTEVAPTDNGSQVDQIIGKRLSLLINNSLIRYFGKPVGITCWEFSNYLMEDQKLPGGKPTVNDEW